MVVEVDTATGFKAGATRVLFEGNFIRLGFAHPSYAVSPDGEHFLMLKENLSDQAQEAPTFIIVQNWIEELNRLAPTE